MFGVISVWALSWWAGPTLSWLGPQPSTAAPIHFLLFYSCASQPLHPHTILTFPASVIRNGYFCFLPLRAVIYAVLRVARRSHLASNVVPQRRHPSVVKTHLHERMVTCEYGPSQMMSKCCNFHNAICILSPCRTYFLFLYELGSILMALRKSEPTNWCWQERLERLARVMKTLKVHYVILHQSHRNPV